MCQPAYGVIVIGRGGPVTDARMARQHDRYDRAVAALSRRQALAAGGVTLLGVGGTLFTLPEPATAAVSVDSFEVSNASFESDGIDPFVDLTVAFEYDVGTHPVSSVELTLAIDGTTVTTETLNTSDSVASAESKLSGRIADSDAWTLEDFAPAIGETVERTVTVSVTFAVLDSNGDAIVSDSVEDTASVSVSHPQDSAYTASVGGSGTVRTTVE